MWGHLTSFFFFYASVLQVKKIQVVWLSESSLSGTIPLDLHTNEHMLKCTLGLEWLIHLDIWDQDNKSSHLFFCWETGPLCPHSSSFIAHSLLTLPSHKSSFTIYNRRHCSAPPHLNSLNLT